MISLIQDFKAVFFVESQPQNPEFRNNPENFHPCDFSNKTLILALGILGSYEQYA